MRIIGPLDQKPFYGVVVAAVAGLMLGGAMKPDLNETALSRAPQLLGPVSADRAEFVGRTASVNDYPHGIPEYVIGTDWTRTTQAAEAAPDDVTYEVAAWDPPAPLTVTDEPEAAGDAPEPESYEPAYPSVGGDILHGVGGEVVDIPDAVPPPA